MVKVLQGARGVKHGKAILVLVSEYNNNLFELVIILFTILYLRVVKKDFADAPMLNEGET